MDPISLVLALALHAPLAEPAPIDFDAQTKAALVDLDSPYMNSQVMAAMAMPYKYGVSQMPCKAKEWQPSRGWRAAREPSGKIEWVPGPVAKAFWSGIYGTCFIQSPKTREQAAEIERTALECECNGWLPEK
jgi:hypothetical protein